MKKYIYFIFPVIASAIFSLLMFTSLDKKVADLFQRALPTLQENPNVKMINVDDASITNIGSWPFSRDVYAEMLLTMRELGTEATIFDLSFLDKSQAKVDERFVKTTLPQNINDDFNSMNEAILGIIEGFETGALTADDAKEAKDTILQNNASLKESLNDSIAYAVRPVDEILANAFDLFGSTFLNLTFNDKYETSAEEKDFLTNSIALTNIVSDGDEITPEYQNVQPSLLSFVEKSKSAGFVNANPDNDGYLRRIHMVFKYNGKYFGQLAFVPILHHFGNPQIEISNKFITLKNARVATGITHDIKIPRDETGAVIVKYPKKQYTDYNCISLWNIYRLTMLEEELQENIRKMDEMGYFGDMENGPVEMYDSVKFVKDVLLTKAYEDNDITIKTYIENRKQYLNSLFVVFYGSLKNSLLTMAGDDKELKADIEATFATVKAQYDEMIQARNELKETLSKAICIVGTTASSTTDFGLNQYEEHYPNPGVHYSIANMLLAEDFVDDAPVWVSIIIAFVISILFSGVLQKIKSTGKQLLSGILALALLCAVLLAIFVTTKVYIGAAIPLTSLGATFIALTAYGFMTASHDKKFITNAFSQCLSKDVVKQLIDDPSSFKLGGERLQMSAIFTDIQKFSSFSELLSAAQLVALLNYYLTRMSDLIMEEHGTVDKYEGDAIVALVGAPLKMDDHASHACAAALKMKAEEIVMNNEILTIVKSPKPETMPQDLYDAFQIMVKNGKNIFTRIGINSGEMIAGYMGSEKKKNYTMMGNNVNLASRLEGVNKQYSTGGIMISEHTKAMLDDSFIVRSLDRVQVVNVKTPLRLYELVCRKADADEQLEKYMRNWEATMKVFESRDYAKALEYFKKLYAIKLSNYGEDKVAKYYINLINDFFIKGKYPTENDDAGVSFNPENGVFTLLQK